ncbi:MAG: hypothetical protein ABJZ62_07570 [Hyphomicrobiales bacterium]
MGKIINHTDEELTAYLDGELKAAKIAEINEVLAHDETLRARLDALSIDKDHLKSTFSALLDEAPTMAPIIIAPPKWNFQQMAAAAVVALTVGLGASALLPERSEQKAPGWRAYVASYQSLYSHATLSHVEITEEAAKAELTRVSAAIGKNFDYKTFSEDQNLSYKRSQILSFKGKPLIQLAFLTPDGKPIALCIIRKDVSNTQIQLGEAEGMKSAFWVDDGYEYLLIGGEDKALIEKTASYYSQHL